ncbi:hypothetical protein VCR15J2_390033 [Vibrio coralliirubri]|uniref:hypothetical protein n=1 Tax=Vibrio coralliirubri TaxID=1516159 RepID=UPI00063A232F|nr:hypothetical protein [Vibrio coralliirubri]CDT52975.1 hypothetical protein VCR15J2_390033 [Vibrio coralliirubri]
MKFLRTKEEFIRVDQILLAFEGEYLEREHSIFLLRKGKRELEKFTIPRSYPSQVNLKELGLESKDISPADHQDSLVFARREIWDKVISFKDIETGCLLTFDIFKDNAEFEYDAAFKLKVSSLISHLNSALNK